MGQSVEPRVTGRRAQLVFFAAGVIALTVLIVRAGPRELLSDVRDAGWAVPAIVAVYGVVYVLNTLSVATAFLLTNLQFALWERNWVPFEATKLACLIAAMVAPGFSDQS